MEAKDTRMAERELFNTCVADPDIFTFADVKAVAQAQAEISFKAGIREVLTEMDWLGTIDAEARKRLTPKLKEWGIE